ncbi:putative polyamine oxidase 5 [Gracilariopsis chorda]|uniref:Putative polyamine oxidase 5 n=1 Tax=Gracilariopsis chorda TaxID=448386 RepID=A0A2V3IW33_9FLOR|nr:putative polyamine oxidase 5 [Gracilariopsis chorda]|eukprot:PXF45927.1 putative polyamine oxidase 5 [Gracilariopsis chorda]
MCDPGPSSLPEDGRHSVAIVGAGLAGLSAASRLRLRHGIHATLFEAQSRPGGRVLSRQLQHCGHEFVIDLGATWWHGTHGNAAYELVFENALRRDAPRKEEESDCWNEGDRALLFSTSAIVVDFNSHVRTSRIHPRLSLSVARAYDRAIGALSNVDSHPLKTGDNDRSMRDTLERSVNYDALPDFERCVFQTLDNLECCWNGCSNSTRDMSTHRSSQYITLPGDNVRPQHTGMTVVVDKLLSSLQPAQILYNKSVTSVHWQHEQGPHLHFSDCSLRKARAVLWTPSLNVTKQAVKQQLFRPQLPQFKLKHLEQRGQGVVEKVFVLLETHLLDFVSDAAVPIIWLPAPPPATLSCAAWCKGAFAILHSAEKRLVSFWLNGDPALELSQLSEKQALEQVSSFLSLVCDQKVSVTSVIRSNWCCNPFVLGSYSYPRLGCSLESVDRLADPLPSLEKPVLCFAGEGTHPHFYSTVHGAIESGYREADRIAAFLTRTPDVGPTATDTPRRQEKALTSDT